MDICRSCKNFCNLYRRVLVKEQYEFHKDGLGRCFKHPNKNMQGRVFRDTRRACSNYERIDDNE